MGEDEIRSLAIAARRAFEERPRVHPFERFPDGCCGDASLVLAQLYRERGAASVVVMTGDREGASHAWLMVEALIVDITGDQTIFAAEGRPAVCVAAESAWHERWAARPMRTQAITDYPNDERWRAPLLHAVDQLRARATT